MINVIQDINLTPKANRGLCMQFQIPRGETWTFIWARITQAINASSTWRISINEQEKRRWLEPNDRMEIPINLIVEGGSYITVENLSFAGTAIGDKIALLVNRKVGG